MRWWRALTLVCVLALGAALVSACGGDENAATEASGGDDGKASAPLRAAFVGPLTGFGADVGQAQLNALKLGLADAEKSGKPKVELTEYDTGESNTTAVSAMKRAVADEPAVISGPYLSTQTSAVRPVIEQAQIPMFVQSEVDAITGNNNQWIFRFNTPQGIQKKAEVAYALEQLNVKRPAILADSTDYGIEGSKSITAALEAAGVSPVATEQVGAQDTDISGQAHSIASAKPDAVFVEIIGGTTGAVALKGLRNGGIDVPLIWSTGGANRGAMLKLVTDDEANGVYVATPGQTAVSELSTDSEIVEFAKRFTSEYDRSPDTTIVQAYDLGGFLAAAAAAGISDSAKMAEYARAQSYEGLLGTYKADEQGNMLAQTIVVRLKGKVAETAPGQTK